MSRHQTESSFFTTRSIQEAPRLSVRGFLFFVFETEESSQHIKMGKILLGIIALVASVMLVDSLTCNQCAIAAFGYCPFSSSVTCAANTSCYTASIKFTKISVGITNQGCTDSTINCNTTTNSTLAGLSYTTTTTCCSTDNCNPATAGAPSAKMTLTSAIGVAALAFMWGSMV
uniref:sperm acrosome membrane-associated protein 4-like n=1 Tax=Monopterus albus TaxID=43700 RepID=UPI0009B2FCC0|nr:sperm acrosome membrane-associated protein 4-like [Monopterus albus]